MKPSKLVRFIARRYLFSRKSHAVVNIISCVSALAVAVPTAAMVVLFSVYNGLDDLLRSLYRNFDLPIKISAVEGKSFPADSLLLARLSSVEGVQYVTQVAEENALAEYRGRQHIGMVRGVDSFYRHVVPIESMMSMGEYALRLGDLEQAVVGMGVAYSLGINVQMFDKLTFYAPRAEGPSPALAWLGGAAYNRQSLFPVGVFSLDADTDGVYTLVPLEFARRLFDMEGRVTSLGVSVQSGYDADRVQKRIAEELGSDYRIQNRYQQKESLYRIMKYEKAGIFLICVLVLLVASLTLVSTLMMLIIDKQQGIFTLRSMGASDGFVRKVFVEQGVYIALIGTVAGMVLGIGLSLAQQYFGLIPIEGPNMLIDAYPVRVKWSDLAVIAVSVPAIDYAIARLTVRSIMK